MTTWYSTYYAPLCMFSNTPSGPTPFIYLQQYEFQSHRMLIKKLLFGQIRNNYHRIQKEVDNDHFISKSPNNSDSVSTPVTSRKSQDLVQATYKNDDGVFCRLTSQLLIESHSVPHGWRLHADSVTTPSRIG